MQYIVDRPWRQCDRENHHVMLLVVAFDLWAPRLIRHDDRWGVLCRLTVWWFADEDTARMAWAMGFRGRDK